MRLECFPATDNHLFVEKGMRGEMLYIAHRYSWGNNAFMNDYDGSKRVKCLMYSDANDWCLLTSKFKNLTDKVVLVSMLMLTDVDVLRVSIVSIYVYILAVDLKCSE